ncbi:MAG: O-phosphoserine--tRNA ligase [Candidatus Nezhaarchaeota archaeon]|nr:O-phosphoserine--tRNA ligase [Candidatus Nezhaarchaeota archaeon]MCX8141590.1 O-phosphoserine--tRNA ligase [Candidatus Nezhaarchaeota archaeon]MDW8049857.1 O-phosphoserine--tRNA ligase [Nitrososphaerota archaeon]
MVRLPVNEILTKSKENFIESWITYGKLIPERRIKPKNILNYGVGKPHPVFETCQRLRQIFLNLGFEEIVNPLIVEDEEVRKQYGPEALAILDRCYYLAVLPRPDVGLGKEKIEQLKSHGVDVTSEKIQNLQQLLHNYKKGQVSGDDLIEELSKVLDVDDVTATKILSEVFPEFKELKPKPTNLTLRSHMTTAWFLTIATLQHKRPKPIKLFSVDVRVRREQQEDAKHLRTHRAASCVVIDEDVIADDGRDISQVVLESLGFKELKIIKKQVTAKYYAPGTEHEVYVRANDEWIEVANYGIYSPVALANYEIEYPVLNVGFGVERIAMILYGYRDVRELVYPQFYGKWSLNDYEIAKLIFIQRIPSTQAGWEIARAITSGVEVHANASSPCEFKVYEGTLLNRHIKVYLYEKDPGVKLAGPAAFNEIVVYNGNVLGIPPTRSISDPLIDEARSKGCRTGIRYVDAFAALAASRVEAACIAGANEVDVKVKMVKLPSDINIEIDDVARRFIVENKKIIDVRGPVFLAVKATLS